MTAQQIFALSQKLFCELRHPVKIPMLLSSAGDHIHLNFCPFFLLHMSLSCQGQIPCRHPRGVWRLLFFSNIMAYLMSEAWSTYTSQHPSSVTCNHPLRATITRPASLLASIGAHWPWASILSMSASIGCSIINTH